ncbi:MAG: maltokinase, partial [Actinomycetota bacterium]|nr:maltokinase [Actinomycetota bacterium]
MQEPSGPLTRALVAVLPEWVARQRWYAGKGAAGQVPVLRHVGLLRLQDPAGEVDIDIHLLLDESAATSTTYQIPLTGRTEPLAGGEDSLVARIGSRYLYDAPHDPVFATALLRLILDEETTALDGSGAVGHRLATADIDDAVGSSLKVSESHVMVGEQSNTSIVLQLVDPDGTASKPLICKLFRVLHDGQNPDVVVQAALSAAGSTRVPSSVGFVTGQWSDAAAATGEPAAHLAHLAFAQEFLPDVEDAWRVALAAIAAGTDFSEQARSLGQATAEVHATLAQAMGTREANQDDVTTLTQRMRSRHAAALFEVPALARHDDKVRAAIEA